MSLLMRYCSTRHPAQAIVSHEPQHGNSLSLTHTKSLNNKFLGNVKTHAELFFGNERGKAVDARGLNHADP